MAQAGGTRQLLRVEVAILTYRRPAELRRVLPAVLGQVVELNADGRRAAAATLVVIDNDPQRSGEPVVRELGTDELVYVHEPTPGISAGRNRALDHADGADVLVFIDDDESPHPGWLAALIDTWRLTRPTAVMGPVQARFDEPLDPWLEAGEFFVRPRMRTGSQIRVAAAGNLLLDVAQVRTLGLRFDPRLGLTGGEDTLFSKQLVRRGGRMLWCDEALADDHVPVERTTRAWVLKRAWRSGLSATVADLYAADTATERLGHGVRAIAHGTARTVAGTLRYLLGSLTRSVRWQAGGLRTAQRGRGMLAGVRGVVYEEYGRSD